MSEPQLQPSIAPEPAAAARRPAAAEGGHTLQAAIGQSAELQPGFSALDPVPPPHNLTPEALAATVDPCTGITIGELRLIDELVQFIGDQVAPWAQIREGDLRFDTRFIEMAVSAFKSNFIVAHPQHLAIHQAPKAREELERRLRAGFVPRYIEEIRATKGAAAAPGLASLVEWLGIRGDVKHVYILTPQGGVEISLGKAEVSQPTFELRYQGGLLPGWSTTVSCLVAGIGASVGAKAKSDVSLSLPGSPLVKDSFNFIHPDEVKSAYLMASKGGVSLGNDVIEIGLLHLFVGGRCLTFDTSGSGERLGKAKEGPRIGLGTGLGFCPSDEVERDRPAPVEPVAPAPRSAVLTPIHLSIYFESGSAEVGPSQQQAIDELVGRLDHIVREAPGAEPKVHIHGRASADWKAARDSEAAHAHNTELAVDRALATRGVLEARLDNAGLPASVAHSVVKQASVGEVEGEVLDREVRIEVSFDLCAPRQAALGEAA